ncbi:MAG: hypothetical protein AAGA27_08340 [Pseudomonadota bacterium]
MIIIRLTWLLILIVFLGGCAHLSGRDAIVRNYEKDYRFSKSIPPLKMPPGMSSGKIESLYPVPTDLPKYTGVPSVIPPGNPGSAKDNRDALVKKTTAQAAAVNTTKS